MLNDHDKFLISEFPKTEYGQAFEKYLRDEISLLEQKEAGLKICDDPLIEDFRVVLGMKIAFKRVLRKSKECFNELNKKLG